MRPRQESRAGRAAAAPPLVRPWAGVLLLVLAGLFAAQPALADGGEATDEGYVMVQQALSFLVTEPGMGTEQALAAVDNALGAEDQDGVDVGLVREARTALEAGRTEEARTLLQDSISEAVAALEPATGEATGTTVVLGPLAPRDGLSGADWVFLALSILVTLLGTGLAYLFRPAETIADLRRDVAAGAPGLLPSDPSKETA